MASFHSNEELFQAVTELAARFEAAGRAPAAAGLREGMACLNGLTDGWAMFLEAIEVVWSSDFAQLDAHDRRALRRIRDGVRRALRRR